MQVAADRTDAPTAIQTDLPAIFASLELSRSTRLITSLSPLDVFWIHRVLQSEGVESHVVDAVSILTSRRGRPAKTDGIDGETLVRTL
jgi:transposase